MNWLLLCYRYGIEILWNVYKYLLVTQALCYACNMMNALLFLAPVMPPSGNINYKFCIHQLVNVALNCCLVFNILRNDCGAA